MRELWRIEHFANQGPFWSGSRIVTGLVQRRAGNGNQPCQITVLSPATGEVISQIPKSSGQAQEITCVQDETVFATCWHSMNYHPLESLQILASGIGKVIKGARGHSLEHGTIVWGGQTGYGPTTSDVLYGQSPWGPWLGAADIRAGRMLWAYPIEDLIPGATFFRMSQAGGRVRAYALGKWVEVHAWTGAITGQGIGEKPAPQVPWTVAGNVLTYDGQGHDFGAKIHEVCDGNGRLYVRFGPLQGVPDSYSYASGYLAALDLGNAVADRPLLPDIPQEVWSTEQPSAAHPIVANVSTFTNELGTKVKHQGKFYARGRMVFSLKTITPVDVTRGVRWEFSGAFTADEIVNGTQFRPDFTGDGPCQLHVTTQEHGRQLAAEFTILNTPPAISGVSCADGVMRWRTDTPSLTLYEWGTDPDLDQLGSAGTEWSGERYRTEHEARVPQGAQYARPVSRDLLGNQGFGLVVGVEAGEPLPEPEPEPPPPLPWEDRLRDFLGRVSASETEYADEARLLLEEAP